MEPYIFIKFFFKAFGVDASNIPVDAVFIEEVDESTVRVGWKNSFYLDDQGHKVFLEDTIARYPWGEVLTFKLVDRDTYYVEVPA